MENCSNCAWSEIIRMRIVHVGQRGEIGLEHILVVPIRKEPQVAVITVTERLDDFLVVSLLGRRRWWPCGAAALRLCGGLGLASAARLASRLRGSSCGFCLRAPSRQRPAGRKPAPRPSEMATPGRRFPCGWRGGRGWRDAVRWHPLWLPSAVGSLTRALVSADSGLFFVAAARFFFRAPILPSNSCKYSNRNRSPPELFRLVEVGGVRQFFPVDRDPLIGIEGELLMLEQIVGVGGALLQPFHKPVEDLAGGSRVAWTAAGDGQVIEVRPVRLELGQVGLREMDMLGVERFQVAIEELAGHRLIERLLQIVVIRAACRR